MTVGELKEALEMFDDDMEVKIGMVQNYGSNFAMNIAEVDVYNVNEWYYGNYKAVVITK